MDTILRKSYVDSYKNNLKYPSSWIACIQVVSSQFNLQTTWISQETKNKKSLIKVLKDNMKVMYKSNWKTYIERTVKK